MAISSNNAILNQMLEEKKWIYRKKYEALIPAHIQLVEKCKNTEHLSEIVSCRQIDVKIRLSAAEKITDETYLKYLLLSLTIVLDGDNVEIILFLAQKIKDENLINEVMRDILTRYEIFEITEYFDKVLEYVTDISILEEFISREESRNPKSKWINVAYNRAMKLLEKQ